MKKGFVITQGKGFHMTFPNGYTVSVQFGGGNYCDNYDDRIGDGYVDSGEKGSDTAECAIIKSKELIEIPELLGGGGDTVIGYCDTTKVLELLTWAASQPRESL